MIGGNGASGFGKDTACDHAATGRRRVRKRQRMRWVI
jgi:hypothetical protein